VVLAIPCALISVHLQLQIYLGYSLRKIVATAPNTLSPGCFLVGCHHLLFCLVRTCKNLVAQVHEKGVEQHLVLVQQKDLFLLVIFSAILLTAIGRLKNKGDSCIWYEHLHPQRHARINQLEENEKKSKLRHHIPQLPSYSGEFDAKVYDNWEMEVDKEFRKSELSKGQKVTIASMVLTNSALNLWTHLARHDKVPKTWKDMKRIFRKECVTEYYANYLLAKLNNLKQGDNSIETYYHNFKFYIMC
jgi:hypothetical protein